MQKRIRAELPELPKFQTNQIHGVVEPPIVYTSKQIPFLQLTRLLDQLSELATFSNEIFASLANDTIVLGDRISRLESRVSVIDKNPTIHQELKPFNRSRNSWQSNRVVPCNFFTPQSMPCHVQTIYDQCPPIPPLEILDEFRSDEFFIEEWKLLIQKEQGEKKRKKIEEEIISPSIQSPLIATPLKQERERVKVQVPLAPGSVPQAPVIPKQAPPPPPPPPSMPPPPPVSTPSTATITETKRTTQPDVNGFLTDIRSRQFVLKKTDVITKEQRKKQNEPDEVVAILMRRAALEASDSDKEEDDDEWN